jgi:hypothetical protein
MKTGYLIIILEQIKDFGMIMFCAMTNLPHTQKNWIKIPLAEKLKK